jgi:hypothetical protein
MTTLLVKHAEVLVTMDENRSEITDGGLFIRDGWIEAAAPPQPCRNLRTRSSTCAATSSCPD